MPGHRNRRFGQGRRGLLASRPPSHSFVSGNEFRDASVAEVAAADSLGNTVLHVAARLDDPRRIVAAMHKIPVTARAAFANTQTRPDAGRSGLRTALHEAALRGNAKVALLLLVHGARLDVRDSHGRTPLEIWARMGHPTAAMRDALALLGFQ